MVSNETEVGTEKLKKILFFSLRPEDVLEQDYFHK